MAFMFFKFIWRTLNRQTTLPTGSPMIGPSADHMIALMIGLHWANATNIIFSGI